MIYPIVGMRHYPPALALIYTIPEGTQLELWADLENKYDAHAVSVHLQTHNIPQSCFIELAQELTKYNHSLASIKRQPNHKLGYIPRRLNTEIFNYINRRQQPLFGTLSFMDDGEPAIMISY